MEQIKISPYTLILFGAVAGLLFGLIPLILGIRKKRARLGATGLICSIIGGAISGIFLSIPVIAIFIYLILKKSPDAEIVGVENMNKNSIDVKSDRSENI